MFWKVTCKERPDVTGIFEKKHVAEWYADMLKRMWLTPKISIVFLTETDD